MGKTDLISRAAAIDYLMTNMGWRDEDGYEVDDADEKRAIITDLVNGIPAVDAVPVVRCEDCWKRGLDNCPMEFYWDSHPADDLCYCAMGERREAGE